MEVMKELAAEGMTMVVVTHEMGFVTMVVVTHEMGFAKEVATKVLFMADGNILEEKPPAEFFTNPEHPRLQDFLAKVLI